ncbi:hypothetical protein RB195_004568 [Necator americanus]|uniref:Uncharacterized protein n=1 Tax=Necator americanus TaxID=51031 RepID=A0ABR1BIQ5_NECAM
MILAHWHVGRRSLRRQATASMPAGKKEVRKERTGAISQKKLQKSERIGLKQVAVVNSKNSYSRHRRRDAQIPTRASLPVPLGSSACFKSLLLECCQILFCISMLWTSTSCKFYTSSQDGFFLRTAVDSIMNQRVIMSKL